MIIARPTQFIAAILCLVALGPLQGAASQPAAHTQPVPTSDMHVTPAPPLPAGVSQDWFSHVTKNIQQSEYHFAPRPDGTLSAPNRAQNLRMTASSDGLQLTSRAETNAWQTTLRLTAWGRPAALAPIEPVAPAATANRLEYRYPGLTEWYVNRDAGLEQGFTVADPPTDPRAAADAAADTLVLELTYTPALTAAVTPDGQTLHFIAATGQRVLDYGGLHVTDATGRALPAHLVLIADEHRFHIQITDAGARYPLTVDPIMTTPAWQAIGDQSDPNVGADFGVSVASAGDVNGDGFSDVMIGADYYDTGKDPSGDGDEGAVFVYYGSASGLPANPSWKALGNQTFSYFGYSVAAAGDVNGDGFSDIIIGASDYTNGQIEEGMVFVWHGGAGGLGPTGVPFTNDDWRAQSNQESAWMGFSVATAGDVNGDGFSDIIIGSFYENGTTFGTAFVWLGAAGGLGANGTPANADWRAESDDAMIYFNSAIAAAGDVNGDGFSDVLVGGAATNVDGIPFGAVFLWLGSPAGLGANGTPANADWRADCDLPTTDFGYAISTAGDVNGDGYSDVIIGDDYYTDATSSIYGAAFVWLGGDLVSVCGASAPSGLGACGTTSNADWSVISDQLSDLGWQVATAGDVNGDGFSDILVADDYYTNPDGTLYGAAFAWFGGPNGLGPSSGTPAMADWTVFGDFNDEFFATAVATAGDVNGDGFSDVLVGDPYYYDDNGDYTGAAFCYYGSAAGLAPTAAWNAEADQASARFGASAASAGDVNGDGYNDVLVGAPDFDNGEINEGRAFLFLGGSAGAQVAPAWTAESNQPNAYLGESVGTAGDVNGDGFGDISVGAPWYITAAKGSGAAFVWSGGQAGSCGGQGPSGLGACGTPANASWKAESDQPNAYFGAPVESAGDVNGDGFGDLAVGASNYDQGQADEGMIFVWHGSAAGLGPTGTPTNAKWSAQSNVAVARLGSGLAAGDVNRDGYSDLLAGAWHYTNGQAEEGAAFLWRGSPTGLTPNVGTPANAAWRAEGEQSPAHFGRAVALGDVNGDGFSDALVGADQYTSTEEIEGAAFLWYGGAAGVMPNPGAPANAAWSAESHQSFAGFGVSVATMGDVNDDGCGDVLIGASQYDTGSPANRGAAFAWHGSSGGLGPSGTPANAAWRLMADTLGAHQFGASVAAVGDVNGDGFSDAIVGAIGTTNPEKREGSAHLFYGNADGHLGDGLDRFPRQLRVNAVNPYVIVSPRGKSDQFNAVRLAALGRTPLGRGKVKLQWEVKPLSQPFNFLGMQQQAAWTDTGAPGALPGVEGSGVPLQDVAVGLSANTPYHWRLRIKSTSPFFPWSPWLTIQPTSRTEEKFRTP